MQVLSLRDRNAELKKVNMETGLEERVELRDEMDEVKEALARRDKEVGHMQHVQCPKPKT